MPHVQVNKDWNACAYTQKDVKFISMMAPRGHEIILYANEGSKVDEPGVEIVQLFTEQERASFFGKLDRQKLIDLKWDVTQPYWTLQFEKAIGPLKRRVRKGDFILSLSGACHQPIAECFPGSFSGTPMTAFWVEYGSGYYGTFSRYVVYESHGHREWVQGRKDFKGENNDDAVIPNYFDVRDFPIVERPESLNGISLKEPYFLFLGRVIDEKGIGIAVDTINAIPGTRLIVAGQGDGCPVHPRVVRFGHATVEERNILMQHSVAMLNPTRFREPFGGTAVEGQIAGTPVITSDHGAFLETVAPEWRCVTHREYVEAAVHAMTKVTPMYRGALRDRAIGRWSLEAVAPMYERYFSRLMARWWNGHWELRDLDGLVIP
jgi:glycosyltransferase involved in cell wall biosynthesis